MLPIHPDSRPAPVECARTAMITATELVGYLDDHVDLDRRAQRQLGDADGAAGVPAGLAEHRAEQLRRAVDHARLAGEALGRRDEADDLDDPDDVGQADQRRRPRRARSARSGRPAACASSGGHLGADLAGREQLAVDHRELAGHVDVVARPHRRHVGARPAARTVRQLKTEFGRAFNGSLMIRGSTARSRSLTRSSAASCTRPADPGSGPGTTATSSQPSSPQLSRICFVAWTSSGTVTYSHFCMPRTISKTSGYPRTSRSS